MRFPLTHIGNSKYIFNSFHHAQSIFPRLPGALSSRTPPRLYNQRASVLLRRMATQIQDSTMSSLTQKISSDQTSQFPNCYPEYNPVDIYREHIASTLSKVTGVDVQTIYSAVAWTKTLDNGDLVLPVSALRMKAKKPEDLATKWASEVWFLNKPCLGGNWADISFHSSLIRP